MDFISCSMLAVYSTNQEQSDNNGKEERQQQVSTLFPATGKPFLKGGGGRAKKKKWKVVGLRGAMMWPPK